MKLHVFFRSCSKVYAFHGGQRIVPEPKSEIILRCFRSLTQSLRAVEGHELTLTVVDDHSHPECVTEIQKILGALPFATDFFPLRERTGNGASLLTNYELARERARELIYFVEDDYLHAPSALPEMLETYELFSRQLQKEIVLFPCDYPDLYARPYSSAIALSPRRYWRSIGHTTGTILLHKKTLLEHWEKYMRFSLYGIDPEVCEDNSINLAYRSTPCFSPMPSLAVHVAYPESVSPYIDWRAWWKAQADPISS